MYSKYVESLEGENQETTAAEGKNVSP
jgi:hypothetical protein